MQVVLDSIRSAHNVGSIFRTADAVGISKLYLCGITPAPLDRFGRLNQRLAKVSLGAERSVAWESYPNILELLAALKKSSHHLVALEQHARAESVFGVQFSQKKSDTSVLVVGAEVDGLSTATLALADEIIQIPMRGKKESLNVSVAFGIAAYTLLHGAPRTVAR